MKSTLTVFTLVLIFNSITNAQSLQDTKDFIYEQIDANDPIPSYDNFVFFKQNILKPDADHLAGKVLGETEFENLFIYGRECHVRDDKSGGIWLTVAQVIDIRGITKVSTTRVTDKTNFYTITIYLNDNYFSKEYSKGVGEEGQWKYLPKMEVLIADNDLAAQKIKKALIHLGQLIGITVKDGDLF